MANERQPQQAGSNSTLQGGGAGLAVQLKIAGLAKPDAPTAMAHPINAWPAHGRWSDTACTRKNSITICQKQVVDGAWTPYLALGSLDRNELLTETTLRRATQCKGYAGLPRQPSTGRKEWPMVQHWTSWSFVNTFLNDDHENALSPPVSPLSRSRPGSASFLRESAARGLRAHSYTGDTVLHGRDQDDDHTHRSVTPGTLRPASAALQPITEGASMDQDSSLADISTFFYDRFRFSSLSTLSDFVATNPRSSPTPAARTGSIASSQNTDVSSTTGSPSTFKPRQLMITRSSSLTGTEPYGHLSRSSCGPLLRSASAQFVQAARHETERRDSRETLRMRSSEVVSSTSAKNIDQAMSRPGRTIEVHREQTCSVAGDNLRSVAGSVQQADTGKILGASLEMRYVRLMQDKTDGSPRQDQCAASQNLNSRSSIPGMLPIDDCDTPSKSVSKPSSPEFNKAKSTLSPRGDHGSATVPKARSSSSPSEGDCSLPSSTLSAPRSTASADSRSSEAVEVVPWQVATTDSDGMRKSEEIFRPLNVVQSRGESPNTVMRGILTSVADSSGSRASTIRKMPPTPLKGVSGAEWASRSSQGDVNTDPGMLSRLPGEGIGLGISHLSSRTGQHSPFAKASVAAQTRRGSLQSRKLEQDHATLQTRVKRHPPQTGRVTSPPGGMDRLLLELDSVTADSQLRRKVEAQPKVDYGTRSSSLRRYHPHGVHISLELPRRSEMASVPFDNHAMDSTRSPRRSRQVDSASRGALPPFDATFAGATKRTGSNTVNRDASPKHSNAIQRMPRSLGLTISLGIFMLIYQSLFCIFEAPYWWITFSPALPLAAAALFLLSNGLIVQLLLQRSSNRYLLLCFFGFSVLSLLYCVVLSVWITIRLIRSPDGGASAPGIHFDRARETDVGECVVQEVLQDMPIPVVLAGIGIIGVVVDAVLAMWLWCRPSCGRHGDVEGR